MKDKVRELKAMGYDILGIIEGTRNEKLLQRFHKNKIYQGVEIPPWTKSDIVNFSNRIFNIVSEYNKD